MKGLAFIFLFLSAAFAVQAQPEMVFEKNERHAGEIAKKGGVVSGEYFFTNTGDEPLVIFEAQGSCDCTRINFPKKPILPGQQGCITVQYDPRKQPQGRVYKIIRVFTNESEGRHILIFSGEVI